MHPTRKNRREQIFDVGARLFAEKGYERTSLQEVADALGVTKPALYYYYSSKEELLFEVMSFCIDRVTHDLEEISVSPGTPSQRLAEFIQRYVHFFADHPDELTLLSTELDSLTGDLREAIVVKQRRNLAAIRAIVTELLEESGETDLDPTVAAFALLGMMNWIFSWYDPEGAIGPDRLANHFHRIYSRGVAASLDGERDAGT